MMQEQERRKCLQMQKPKQIRCFLRVILRYYCHVSNLGKYKQILKLLRIGIIGVLKQVVDARKPQLAAVKLCHRLVDGLDYRTYQRRTRAHNSLKPHHHRQVDLISRKTGNILVQRRCKQCHALARHREGEPYMF